MFVQKYKMFNDIIPLISSRSFKKEVLIIIQSVNLLFTLNVLKKHINYQYKLLSCISGIDLFNNTYRFCVSYDLLSLVYNSRVRVKTFTDEITSLNSSTEVFINANWWEREIWDLYGVYFNNHNDLRRILTDYGFEGHPMRKDFPLFGYTETCYNESKKRIIIDRVQLTQEFRVFSYEISC